MSEVTRGGWLGTVACLLWGVRFGVWSLGFGCGGLGFGGWGLGFGVWDLGFKAWGSGFGVRGLGLGFGGLGFGVWESKLPEKTSTTSHAKPSLKSCKSESERVRESESRRARN